MTVTDTATPELERILTELKKLRSMRIKIGIQGDADSEILMIANVHEYGCTITPKHSKNLCIPIAKESYDKSPRDFPDLFFISGDGDNGKKILYGVTKKKNRGKEGDDLNFLFMLLPSVTIPERSFIRAGYDTNKNKLVEIVKKQLHEVVYNGKTAEQAANLIGGGAVDLIHEYMSDASNFKPKGSIQRERYPSWANNPLAVTKRLFNSITFKVEEDG